ncbi:unnamed protein product [Litomosoides sigmodontis]|uniref:Uncharacterized protein n=1 Tax=Litomosoides sigmodontis TaxID=42156 RepID=A0A3P6TDM6_LITSI|nr:unnamed protein product [Litomosoides sigmodontis]
MSVERRPSAVSLYDHQYADQENTEKDWITDIFPEVLDAEQFDEANVHAILSQSYSDKSREKLIEDALTNEEQVIELDDEIFAKMLEPLIITETPKATLTDANFTNLPAFTTLPLPPTAIISTTITPTTIANRKKYKISAYITNSSSTSSEDSNVENFSNATDKFSNFGTTDSLRSLQRNTNLMTSTAPQQPIFNNLTTINSHSQQLIENDRESSANQFAAIATEFARNLQRTTISTPPTLIEISLNLPQQSTAALDKVANAENDYEESEDDTYNYEYENIMDERSAITTISTSTTTTTTTTMTTVTTGITVPKISQLDYPNHNQPDNNYDRQSAIIVTALFDIGRGKWPRYTRTYEQYMYYMKYLLNLKNYFIIYTDKRGAQFVRLMRNSRNTQIFEMSINDLPLYRYREEMEGIMRREQASNWRFDPKTRYHPEANSADYNIIVNSKPYFLYNATQSARFPVSDRMFAWIDAGYGHGQEGCIPSNCHWRPNLQHNRITIIKLTPAHDKASRYSISDLYRVDWVVVSGGFIAGDSYTINRFYRFYQKSFMELLDSGRVDDDQVNSLEKNSKINHRIC